MKSRLRRASALNFRVSELEQNFYQLQFKNDKSQENYLESPLGLKSISNQYPKLPIRELNVQPRIQIFNELCDTSKSRQSTVVQEDRGRWMLMVVTHQIFMRLPTQLHLVLHSHSHHQSVVTTHKTQPERVVQRGLLDFSLVHHYFLALHKNWVC